MTWQNDEHTDDACWHDWIPISGAEFCHKCGGVRKRVEP